MAQGKELEEGVEEDERKLSQLKGIARDDLLVLQLHLNHYSVADKDDKTCLGGG